MSPIFQDSTRRCVSLQYVRGTFTKNNFPIGDRMPLDILSAISLQLSSKALPMHPTLGGSQLASPV
jgi:hypothetical protein